MRAAMAADVRVRQPQPADAVGRVPAGEPAAARRAAHRSAPAGDCRAPASAGFFLVCQNRAYPIFLFPFIIVFIRPP